NLGVWLGTSGQEPTGRPRASTDLPQHGSNARFIGCGDPEVECPSRRICNESFGFHSLSQQPMHAITLVAGDCISGGHDKPGPMAGHGNDSGWHVQRQLAYDRPHSICAEEKCKIASYTGRILL